MSEIRLIDVHDGFDRPGGDGSGDFTLVACRPAIDLRGDVRRIIGYRETRRDVIAQTETASLIVPLVISFGEPFEIGLGREPGREDGHGSFAAGLYAGPVHIRSYGAAHCLQIDFSPAGAYRFFGLPMHRLAGRMVSLEDLGDADLVRLRHQLGEERSWRARFVLAERFVRARLSRRQPVSPAVARAYGWIVRSGGSVPIAAVASELGWSRKHLAARFREEIGSVPKSVARIARFNKAAEIARDESAGGWADIAAACGYADQAHLVREFRAFAGATPENWRATLG